MVVFYTFSVVVVVVVVVGGEGVDAGKREGGEAVGEAVGCGRRGVGDGSEGVDVGERGGVVTVGEAVRGGRREVDGVGAGGEGEGGADGGKVVGWMAVVVEVGRRKVEVEEGVAGQDEAVFCFGFLMKLSAYVARQRLPIYRGLIRCRYIERCRYFVHSFVILRCFERPRHFHRVGNACAVLSDEKRQQ